MAGGRRGRAGRGRLGLTDSAVGLTVLALTTSDELFALALAAVRRDVAKIAMGLPAR